MNEELEDLEEDLREYTKGLDRYDFRYDELRDDESLKGIRK